MSRTKQSPAQGKECTIQEYGSRLPPVADLIFLEIGGKGNLGRVQAKRAAKEWERLSRTSAKKIMIILSGYDDDSREIWEIPDAAEHVRMWAKRARIDVRTATSLLHEYSAGLLARCECDFFAGHSIEFAPSERDIKH